MRLLYSNRALAGALTLVAATLSFFSLQLATSWGQSVELWRGGCYELAYLRQSRAIVLGAVCAVCIVSLSRKRLRSALVVGMSVAVVGIGLGFVNRPHDFVHHDPLMVVGAFAVLAFAYEMDKRWMRLAAWSAAVVVLAHLRAVSSMMLCASMVGIAAFVVGTRRQRIATGAFGLFAALTALASLRSYQLDRIRSWWLQNDPHGSGWAAAELQRELADSGPWGSAIPWHENTHFRDALWDHPWVPWVHDHGWVLGVLLLGVFVGVGVLAFRLAYLSEERSMRALALGIGVYWLLSVFLSVAGPLGLVPIVATTLPLLTLGTSSTLAGFASLGFLWVVARALEGPNAPA